MANQSATNVSPANSTQKYFAESFCNATQKVIEQVTWDDALKYAQALASWQSNGSFQPAMDLYMGNDSRGQLGAVLRGMGNKPRKDTSIPSLSSANCENSSQH